MSGSNHPELTWSSTLKFLSEKNYPHPIFYLEDFSKGSIDSLFNIWDDKWDTVVSIWLINKTNVSYPLPPGWKLFESNGVPIRVWK